MLVLNSEITIGHFRFEGVHEVVVSRSLYTLADKAVIQLPATTLLQGQYERVPTGRQFSDGDPVTIRLGYSGELRTEFTGFVTRRTEERPMTVHCEGYGSLLAKVNVSISAGSVSLRKILTDMVGSLPHRVTVNCETDVTFSNVQLSGTGADLLKAISRFSDGTLCCWFPKPDQLWCGFLHTAWSQGSDPFGREAIALRAGYNVLSGGDLIFHERARVPPAVAYTKRLKTGGFISGVSDVYNNSVIVRRQTLNQIETSSALRQMANEKALRISYTGFEGGLICFLDPATAPGGTVRLTDDDYPSRSGTYLVTSTTATFGINGARRRVELGPRLGFQNEQR